MKPITQTGPLATLMEIVEQHTAKPLRWQGGEQQAVDVTTANMLLTVLNAIDAEKREKVTTLINRSRLDFLKVVDIGWRCVH